MSNANQFVDTFRQEAEELLAEIEETVLEIEKNPEDLEQVNRLFRAMHTIKGSGGMFGFDDIAGFTHHVETALDKVRDGSIPVKKGMIDLILASRDHIHALLDAAAGGDPVDEAAGSRIIAGLAALTVAPAPATQEEPDATQGKELLYRIRFTPLPNFAESGMDPADLLDGLRELGNCEIMGLTDAIPPLENLVPDQCWLYWDIALTTARGLNAIKDVFIFVEDKCRIEMEAVTEAGPDDPELPIPKLGEILIQKGDADPEEIKRALAGQKRIGELLVASGAVSEDKVFSALKEQKIIDQRRLAAKAASVRVPSDKLDHLVNLVGELVITQARLSQVAHAIKEMELATPVEEIERLTAELRDVVLNIRMLPIGTTFSKFNRLVRDLSADLGKTIRLITEGAETELDKTVIERLNDPLVHLIRNSIDHGIEAPGERIQSGKPEEGTISLMAAHRGAKVVITIKDDGRGLDRDAIRQKAIEKGLISPEAKLADKEIWSQIFAAGFSTAKQVTSVSGRGVGMDVVKREIESLGGSVDITSQKGRGTAIHLSLPLTLAIIDGLLVKVAGNFFVLPLSMIEECVELPKEKAETTHGRNVIPVRGELVPLIRLREFFDIRETRPSIEHIAIVRLDDLRMGIVVDHIIGDHQTVIKSLGKIYQDADGLSGATIMGDGTVALILDIPELVRCACNEEMERLTGND
ncbi:MAG: chemotaxis protein CheA [Thermodesulfobacteriota bacterium]